MTSVLDQARQGITLADEYVSTYSEYAIEQDLMFDYILDWSTANDEALELAANQTQVSAGSDPLMLMAGAVPRRGAGMKTEGNPRKQLAKAKMRGEFSFSIDGVMFKSPTKSFNQLMRRHMPGARNSVAKTRNDPVPGSIKSPSELKQACKDICDKMGRNPAFREKLRGTQSGRFEE